LIKPPVRQQDIGRHCGQGVSRRGGFPPWKFFWGLLEHNKEYMTLETLAEVGENPAVGLPIVTV
jgi:hypothetical protein